MRKDQSARYLALGALLFVSAASLSAWPQAKPATPAAEPDISGDPARGRYIAESVAMCVECHSGRDDAGNIVESERYLGAPIPFRPPWPNDWAQRAPRNRGLPGYDESQAMRLLMQGAISRQGTQLRLPMPRFHMTHQDAADVVAYLRSLR